MNVEEYIRQAQAAGLDKYQVRHKLLEAGWSETDIRYAFESTGALPPSVPTSTASALVRAVPAWLQKTILALLIVTETLLILRVILRAFGTTTTDILVIRLFDSLTLVTVWPGQMIGSLVPFAALQDLIGPAVSSFFTTVGTYLEFDTVVSMLIYILLYVVIHLLINGISSALSR